MMNDIQVIQSKIYEIRGVKVMLDRDLAQLYHVTTGNLNKAVKRNSKRFPPDFMFQLTKEEYEFLRFQNGILKTGRGEHSKFLPYAFTEQGLAMLSGVLNSDIAIQVNITIMRAFVSLRHLVMIPDDTDRMLRIEREIKGIKEEMEDILHDQNDINESTRAQLDAISTALAELQADRPKTFPRRKIGFVQD